MGMMGERDREFFEPLWRRIVLVALLLAWTAWEWSNGDSLWGTLVAGLTAYFLWAYLITFPGKPAPDDAGETSARRPEE
jgi:hypothetical protein